MLKKSCCAVDPIQSGVKLSFRLCRIVDVHMSHGASRGKNTKLNKYKVQTELKVQEISITINVHIIMLTSKLLNNLTLPPS